MKYQIITFTLLPSITVVKAQEQTTDFSYPPEWEPHEAMWMSINDQWPDAEMTAWQVGARIQLAYALQKYIPVKILTNKDSLATALLGSLEEMGADPSRLTTIVHPLPNYFIRDTGPIFLTNGSELKVANWNWKCINHWCDEVNDLRGTIDDSLSVRFNYTVEDSPINYEGGAIVVNNHSALSIKDYALEQTEGEKTIEEIEQEILRLYGKKQVIWLEGIPLMDRNGYKVGKFFGQGADGHADAFVRFANDSTLLVTTIAAEEKDNTPIAQHDYEIFQGYLTQLKEKRQVNGKPFTIVEIPSPDLTFHQFQMSAEENWDMLEQYEATQYYSKEDTVIMVPTMGYANYLVTNGAVFVAQYWEEGLPETEKQKDEQMVRILETYFPDRKVVGINAKDINWFGGGIHCATQQQPKIN